MQVRQTLVNTRDYPPGERLEFFREVVGTSIVPTEIRSEHRSDFDATIRMLDLGAVGLSIFRFPSLESCRTARMIRRSDPDIYSLNLTLRGQGSVDQDRQTCVVRQRQFSFFDMSSPHTIRYVEDRGDADPGSTAITVQIPHALLPIPANKARRLNGVGVMSGRAGIGGLLAHHLCELPRHAGELRSADVARVGTITLDLAAAMLVHHLNLGATALPLETRQQVTYTRIHAFIERHLSDPALTPPAVAAAHHISLRTLHRLFQTQGTTVAEWIRQRRLDRCRRDLADLAFRAHSIQAIAARWGFVDAAHFSRVFSTTYGMSPRAYRHHHKTTPTPEYGPPPPISDEVSDSNDGTPPQQVGAHPYDAHRRAADRGGDQHAQGRTGVVTDDLEPAAGSAPVGRNRTSQVTPVSARTTDRAERLRNPAAGRRASAGSTPPAAAPSPTAAPRRSPAPRRAGAPAGPDQTL
ncbi:helix-turn-helix domain-containing protein [Plantactinospora sp. CA-294935]|uniref:AraC-like ligand-binding domain-containing protein n=1 Tax=Plantactinospora sp. CA-294935 TaxID=3240012 RepID=UPI003D9121FC